MRHIEQAKVWPNEEGSPARVWRILDLIYDNYPAACAAVATEQAAIRFHAAFPIATGGLTILFTDELVERSSR